SGADGIDAEAAEFLEAALPDRKRNRRAERAAVVVETNALQLEILPVEPETGVGFEFERADAERDFFVLKHRVVPALLDDVDRSAIQTRRSDVPQLRMFDRNVQL